jgi:hypothetical protein
VRKGEGGGGEGGCVWVQSGVSKVAASSTDKCHNCRGDITGVGVGYAQCALPGVEG